MPDKQKDKNYFWVLGLDAINDLESDQGILASGREELYGCIFGRDSLITSLKLLRVYKKSKAGELLELVRKVLLNLVLLQGKQTNIESGEQPGKCIHEFRPTRHEHLTKREHKPWYVYEDQVMRNYDSIDATPLLLIAIYRYWQVTQDGMFLNQVMPGVEAALEWIEKYGDSNGDGFVDYELSTARTSGGLATQNWMDSEESVFHETGEKPVYPLAPVEVQAYVYLAYRLWAKYFIMTNPFRAARLVERANELKKRFNRVYPTQDPDWNKFLAFKLDGDGRILNSVRSNMGHVLWASTTKEDDGQVDCILEKDLVASVVKRLLMPDMFDPSAGIRTLSAYSKRFDFNSYHNGSIWPHDNAMIAEGFQIHGFTKEAEMVYQAMLRAIGHFETPIELFVYEKGKYSDFLSDTGQRSCKVQAWSAAAILDAVTYL